MADTNDRRLREQLRSSELKRELNEAQLATLHTLEGFGWHLKFIRHPPGQPRLVVLQDPDTGKFAVLGDDGELDENPIWQEFRKG
jgi:hypothetical protein